MDGSSGVDAGDSKNRMTQEAQLSRNYQRHFLCTLKRYQVARAATRLPTLVNATVYGYFRRWRTQGYWLLWNTTLRQRLRKKLGRTAEPSAALVDSQSIRTAEGGDGRGYDAHKRR